MNDVLLLGVVVALGVIVAFYDVGSGTWRSFTPAAPGSLSTVSFNTGGLSDEGFRNASERSWYASLFSAADIVALQELRGDADGLRRSLRRAAPANHTVVLSEELGRTEYYTERYAFVVNTSSIQVGTSRIVVSVNESVNRPPLALRFSHENASFTAYDVHTDPETAEEEIPRVATAVSGAADNRSVVLGDFNADCDYYDPRPTVRGLHWVVGADADTTTSRTDCAYDRVLVDDAAQSVHRTSSVVDVPRWLSDHKPVRATFGGGW